MNILESLKSFFKFGDDDPVQIDLTRAQQTNVPSRPRLRGSMPSTRSETAISLKPTVSSRNANPRKPTRRWLDQHDHMPQDPIEVSDGEEDTENQTKRDPRPQLTRTSPPQSARRYATPKASLQRRQDKNIEEGRLLGDYKKPPDAFVIEIPLDSARESNMPKKRFLAGGHRPMNTLDRPSAPVLGSKGLFIDKTLGRTPTKAAEPKKRNLSLHRNSGPQAKRQRSDDDSPDPLQERGSRHIKLALASVNNSLDDLTSSSIEPLNTRLSHATRSSQAGRHSPTPSTGFKKMDVPWSLHKPTAKLARKIASHHETVISDDDEENFTKDAARERRRQEPHDDEVVESRHETPRNGISPKTVPTSTTSAQHHSSSPSKRIQELEIILPDSILQPQEANISSPDIIQDHGMASDNSPKASRRSKTSLTDTLFSNLPKKESKKSLGQFSTPVHIKLFRSKRMLFRRAIEDASGYVLAVDKDAHTFSIHYDSNNLGHDPILPDTPVNRILRVSWGNNGAKVKIETSKMDIIGHEILIELNSPKLAYDLVVLLTKLGTDIKTATREDEWLDRAFDKFDTSSNYMHGVRHLAQQQASSIESPYFSQTEAKRRHKAETDYAMSDRSFVGVDRSTHTFKSQAGESLAGRRQTMLQDDLEQRHSQKESERAPEDLEKVVSRLRDARRSATRTSPKQLPPKYSQSGQLGNPWGNPLTYPKSGKKRATVNFDDLSRLDDDEFLNDNIIAFFLRYLEHHLEQEHPNIAKRSYFFNSYFYEKLRQNPKDKKNVNYEGVKKWTDKIGLFNRDFVVVPVNENLHWYVTIICNLSWFKLSEEEKDALDAEQLVSNSVIVEEDITTENANDTQRSLQELSLEDRECHGDILASDIAPESSGKSNGSAKKKGRKRKSEPHLKSVSAHLPAIITLDSLNMPRYATVSALKQYIAQEARERLNKDIDVSVIQGVSAKKIPMQSNHSDCGLFVCAYLERFAMDSAAFVKKELGRIPQQWPELHSHDLRSRMRELILKLHNQQEAEATDATLPSVGEILLPLATSPRSASYGALVEMENGDEKMYEPPTSPVLSDAQHSRQNKRHRVKESPDSEDELMDPGTGHAAGAHCNDDPKSLKARTAKILNSPTLRYSGSFTVPESDHEQEIALTSFAKDDPRAMAKRLRTARSPKSNRKARRDSVSTDFLNGHESYEHTDQQMPGDDLDDNEKMLV